MKKIICSICENPDIPLNSSIRVDGQDYCEPCLGKSFPLENMLAGRTIEKDNDPTICAFCQNDYGDQELKKISEYPICADCEIDVKNKTFPLWVKAFFVAILVIVCFSFTWNWKYYTAYKNLQNSFAYFHDGDLSTAVEEISFARSIVPEDDELKVLEAYFKGVDFLMKDKNTEALSELMKCTNRLPDEYNLVMYINQAEMRVAFENKDYDEFLESAKVLFKRDSTYATPFATVASAYACVYASKGDEDARLKAFDYLGRAKKIDSITPDMKSYYNAIEYRIATRDIVSREEFSKKFPQGWVKN